MPSASSPEPDLPERERRDRLRDIEVPGRSTRPIRLLKNSSAFLPMQ